MGGLIELGTASALADFISQNKSVVVTFSAHWCGPCKASKPALETLATKYSSSSGATKTIKIGIIYEDELGNDIQTYNVRAFPTYVLYQQSKEVNRVEGANIPKIESMIESASGLDSGGGSSSFIGSGNSLGGTTGSTVSQNPSLQEARLARLARLGGGGGAAAAVTTTTTGTPAVPMETTPAATNIVSTIENNTTTTATIPMEVDDDGNNKEDGSEKKRPATNMEGNDEDMKTDEPKETIMKDPTEDVDAVLLKQLTEELGFSLIRAQKSLLYCTKPPTMDNAIEWLTNHQDDTDIDEPIKFVCVPIGSSTSTAEGLIAQSYKCNECGKILSNMANLELHANKTGHSDFEESTTLVQPLSAEEKLAKVAEIKELLKVKRAQREEIEAAEEIVREKQRRSMGQEVKKTREQLEIEQRKRDAKQRQKEKLEFAKERQRLREQLARDKAERAAANGKLASKLSIEGYRPDMLQHNDKNSDTVDTTNQQQQQQVAQTQDSSVTKYVSVVNVNKISECISKVSNYRAGGDGGKCLKILFLYVKNIVENPTEDKYKTIKMDNNVYKTKVKPFVGAKSLLLAIGFIVDPSNDQQLILLSEHVNLSLLADVKEKLNSALIAFG